MDKLKIKVLQVGERVGIFIEREGKPTLELFADACDIVLDEEVADPFNLSNRVTIWQNGKGK